MTKLYAVVILALLAGTAHAKQEDCRPKAGPLILGECSKADASRNRSLSAPGEKPDAVSPPGSPSGGGKKGNNGHGNDPDHNDASNPGNSNNGDGTDADGSPGNGKGKQ
jgi:hypothetical protein